MVRVCLVRGCRISFMLMVLACVALFIVFYVSPDIRPFSSYVESKIKKEMQADECSISNLKLAWDDGPVVDFGRIILTRKDLVIHDVSAQLSYSFFRMFRGSFVPELRLSGGMVSLNLDENITSQSSAIAVLIAIEDIQLNWTLNQETQTFYHLSANIPPAYSNITFQADGLNGYLDMGGNGPQQLKKLRLYMRDFSGLPASWLKYVSNVATLKVDVRLEENNSWHWQVDMKADDGLLSVPSAHVQVPLTSLYAEGQLMLEADDMLRLKQFEATTLQWQNGVNFADFTLNWQKDVLHIAAQDGSTTMPMLWSWLWMLGGEEWHQWLNSMQSGRLEAVNATLDLDWQTPLHAAPTAEDFDSMQYHMTTHAFDADVALGLAGDFLYQVDAKVEIDQNRLTAQITSAVLNDDVGTVQGDYAIVWDSLMMDIKAKGFVDAGKVHNWLSPDSAKELYWGKAPATVEVEMQWDVDKSEPDLAKVYLKPTKKHWTLQPKGMPLTLLEGLVFWDINKGLDLKNMVLKSPWFDGNLSMSLDKNSNWALAQLHLDGEGALSNLTEQFGLPIINPKGQTKFDVVYQHQAWSGYLDFSGNDWDSFAGYDKPADESIRINFSGKPTETSLLPIYIDEMNSSTKDFQFESAIRIDEQKIDLQFKQLDTPAIQGNLRVLVPFNKKLALGLEAELTRLDKSLWTAYFRGEPKKTDDVVRPLSLYVNTEALNWDKISAKGVRFQYFSDQKGTGNFKAESLITGNADLKNVSASFTMLGQGKFDLHHLEADGSDQHMVISGSVQPLQSGALAWNGLAFIQGKFGTLMKKAELNKLFQEGDMASLFVGKGEFMQGEPWWRGMEGSFRLRVNDGRILETGTLTHLLAAISFVDLPKYLIFQRSDVVGKGLLYEKLQVEGTFNAEVLDIHRLALASSALAAGGTGKVNFKSGTMDVMLIARPWQNIEAFIGNIPLFGYILAGEDKSFLRKVYRIHGPVSDATVDAMDPNDAGLPRSGLLETLFSLPSQWFGD